jgi:2-C-methyl-D-erythritol 4-phosphate cytidylyltransferase
MGQDIPKQFLNVNDKPVLLYTLEGFQNHPDIDEITLVCLDGWQNVVDAYARQFGIEKLVRIVAGGASGQESIRNGVFALEGVADPDDLVVIHDGIRPLVDDHVLSDVVRVAREKGNAVTSLPYNEQIFVVSEDDPSTTSRYIPRETLRRVSTPQAYRFGELDAAYHEAFERGVGIDGSHYTNTMMVVLGHTLNFADGSDRNIKLTTRDDLEMFKAYLAMDRDDWLK